MTDTNHAHVAETLHRAADLIEERGWVVGTGWPREGREGAPLCLEGGIAAAMGMTFRASITNADAEPLTTCPAFRAVQSHLEMDIDDDLYAWNDHPARTATEVIEVLRATAAIEQAKHAAEVTSPHIPAFDSVVEMRAIADSAAAAAATS